MPLWKPNPSKPPAPVATPDNPEVTQAPIATDTQQPLRKPNLTLQDEKKAAGLATPVKGFDPYNSGAFDRRHTWEKVTRK